MTDCFWSTCGVFSSRKLQHPTTFRTTRQHQRIWRCNLAASVLVQHREKEIWPSRALWVISFSSELNNALSADQSNSDLLTELYWWIQLQMKCWEELTPRDFAQQHLCNCTENVTLKLSHCCKHWFLKRTGRTFVHKQTHVSQDNAGTVYTARSCCSERNLINGKFSSCSGEIRSSTTISQTWFLLIERTRSSALMLLRNSNLVFSTVSFCVEEIITKLGCRHLDTSCFMDWYPENEPHLGNFCSDSYWLWPWVARLTAQKNVVQSCKCSGKG